MKFFCANDDFKNSSSVLVGLCFDGTSSFRSGSRFAPNEARRLSEGIESYSPYFDKDLEDIAFFDDGDIDLTISNFEKFSNEVKKKITFYLKENKKVLSIGGEHLVSLPVIETFYKKYNNLKVVHFDAHADLRDTYLDEKYSHATVLRRVCEIIKPQNLYQFGIRSGTKDEFEYGKKYTNFHPFDLDYVKKYVKELEKFPVYLTIDLDVLDPSIFPGTGTPEPGGVSFNELLQALKELSNLNIVGIDLVELSPDYDRSGVSTMVLVKLIRECLIILGEK